MHPRWSPDGTEIAYDGTRFGTSSGIDLYVVQPGQPARQLTSAVGWERQPAWSPDGKQIAYTSYPNGVADIFVMNADGSHPRNVTDKANTDEYEPSWSPSGIAFRSNGGGRDEIYVMNPNGTNVRMLTSSIQDGDPNWSRDGRYLLFDSGRDATSEIGVYQNDQYRSLTHGNWFDTDPSWSPDGRRIAFSRSKIVGRNDLYIVDAASGKTRRLTHSRGMDWAPAWSPNGKQIAFVRYEGFGAQIWLSNANGTHQHALTSSGSWNTHPSWSPDSRRIVYSGRRNGNYNLFVINTRTARQQQITHDRSLNLSPAWSPDGSLIAYVSPADQALDDIWVIHPDGTGKHVITHGDADSESPTWAPDGSTILYSKVDFLGGEGTLWTTNPDGSNETTATRDLTWSTASPSWQPLH
jgi:Tol biopolymer transport system component